MAKIKEIGSLFIDSGIKWSGDRSTRLAAALAYYTLFSLAPLLIILTGIASQLLEGVDVGAEFVQRLSRIVGVDAATWLYGLVEGSTAPTSLTLATIISLGVMFWGASNIFNHLKETLNHIWGIKKGPGRQGILASIRGRLLAFAVVLITGLMLVIYVAALSLAAVLEPLLTEYFPELLPRFQPVRTFQIGQFVILLIGLVLLFAFIYKVLPDAVIDWRDVLVGAGVTAAFFTIGTIGLGIYFRFFTVGSLYGAAASIMVVLFWFYYSAQIFLFGAEFTYVYANRYGSRILPSELAVSFEVRIDEENAGLIAEPPKESRDE